MKRRFRRSHTLIDETRERLNLAAAVAVEAVQTAHVRFALDLLDEAAERVPVERLLGVYARLLHLADDQRRQLTGRVLAALGRDPHDPRRARLEPRRSPLHRAVHRLRGRVHPELRAWLDRHAARAGLAVLEVHTEHGLRFAGILAGERTPDEAVRLYAEDLGLRPTMAEMVRLRVLAEAPLPGEEEQDVERGATVAPLHPRTPRAFRLANDGG